MSSRLDLARLCAQTCAAYFSIASSSCVCLASPQNAFHKDADGQCTRGIVYKAREQASSSVGAASALFALNRWAAVSQSEVDLLKTARIEAHVKWIDEQGDPFYVYMDADGQAHGSGKDASVGEAAQILVPYPADTYEVSWERLS